MFLMLTAKPSVPLLRRLLRFFAASTSRHFAPHADCGDHVIVINAGKIVLTGNKLEKKMYYHHTGYIGNMKKIQYKTLMAEKPEFALKKAVKGMLPDNSLGRKQLTRLRIFKDGEHTHEAQKPEVKEF